MMVNLGERGINVESSIAKLKAQVNDFHEQLEELGSYALDLRDKIKSVINVASGDLNCELYDLKNMVMREIKKLRNEVEREVSKASCKEEEEAHLGCCNSSVPSRRARCQLG
ncbi:hypothetical protein L1987_07527 [Smallanthus sonchifolius]|uniref:Uncharacterized protein n=1 Tax=Smallanthus sonchifolius TaxID=185202 RepID=A0ACB9K0M7_9ASTR|nr:hypothetical protein L1987_07527 [Smallanthus sonchifolius]